MYLFVTTLKYFVVRQFKNILLYDNVKVTKRKYILMYVIVIQMF
jgi:hypothetical protein